MIKVRYQRACLVHLVRFFDLVEYQPKLRYFLIGGSLYHELNYQRIERNTAFGKRTELMRIYLAAVIADDRKKCLRVSVGDVIGNICSVAGLDLDKALCGKLAYACVDNSEAHAHDRTKLSCRRQLISGLQLAGKDLIFDLTHKYLSHRRCAYFIKGHSVLR